MFSLEILVMVSAIVFCVGGLLGAVISRTLMPPEQQKELEKSLQLTRQELNQYQQDVAQHFAETSKLVHNLTQSYKDVHEHLAKGAVQLTNSEISRQILEAGESTLGIEVGNSIEEVQPQAPRDWAPKTPGQTGTLSEEYGLSDDPSQTETNETFYPGKTGS
ncbi:YhcB family protein [Teredinibacter haidensis]|uniref:YhcB family protein n=1 Tax=Teredinibacter haidensis TaxID=2731755 RepID=UPI000ADA6BDC|nr:YhcB family protein [Teredinibacter haidensis]